MTIKEFRIKLQMLALTVEGEDEDYKQLYQLSETSVSKFEVLINDMSDANLIKGWP